MSYQLLNSDIYCQYILQEMILNSSNMTLRREFGQSLTFDKKLLYTSLASIKFCLTYSGQQISQHEHLDAVYSVAPHPTMPSVVITASEDGCVYTVDTREPYRRGESFLLV